VGASNIVKANRYSEIIGDDTTETAKQNYEIVRDFTENQVIFGGNYFTDFLKPSRCWIVWDKQNTGNFADAELAWTSFEKGVKLYKFMWNGLAREGSREVELKKRVHPTQKPVGMIANILQDFSKEGDTILDCFGGSGSTLIACEQTNRKCRMMELDPHYCDVIIKRWETLTGGKAELLTDGK
jgi:DNA modification methylase